MSGSSFLEKRHNIRPASFFKKRGGDHENGSSFLDDEPGQEKMASPSFSNRELDELKAYLKYDTRMNEVLKDMRDYNRVGFLYKRKEAINGDDGMIWI